MCITIDDINKSFCRASLICPLFKLLQNAFFDSEWIHVAANQGDLHYHASSENSQSIADAAVHIQQELLLILEDITASVTSEVLLWGLFVKMVFYWVILGFLIHIYLCILSG